MKTLMMLLILVSLSVGVEANAAGRSQASVCRATAVAMVTKTVACVWLPSGVVVTEAGVQGLKEKTIAVWANGDARFCAYETAKLSSMSCDEYRAEMARVLAGE